jgi:hypothetical protein
MLFLSGTEGVIAKIEAFAHQEFNNDGVFPNHLQMYCVRKFHQSFFVEFKSKEAITKVIFHHRLDYPFLLASCVLLLPLLSPKQTNKSHPLEQGP